MDKLGILKFNVKYALFGSVLFVLLNISFAHTYDLDEYVNEKLGNTSFKGSIWGGIASYTNDSSNFIFSHNADLRLTPASTLKLLTTAAALELLGPTHKFTTELYAQGTINEEGVLNGNLYIRAGGDPTLGSTRVVGSRDWKEVLKEWGDSIKEAHITQINGDIIVDESLFEGLSVAPKVNWENMGNYYAAPVSPLCFNDNLFEIHFKPQPNENEPTLVDHIEPNVPNITFDNHVITDKKNTKDNAYVYAAPNQYEILIEGTIPANSNGFAIKAALPNSALFVATALRNYLNEQKITVKGNPSIVSVAPIYENMQLLHTIQSPELKDIIYIVNKRSFNLYAEMLLRHLALQSGQKGSLQNGLKVLRNFLKEHKICKETDIVLYDGSGLSRDNLLTPTTLLNVLVYMSKSENFTYFYNSLATANDRGDLLLLRKFLATKNKVDIVRVKGGTIDSVKALAGYTNDQDNHLIAFVFMANNLADKSEDILRFHEGIIKQLLELPQPKKAQAKNNK